MTISIIIPTYNEANNIKSLLDSIDIFGDQKVDIVIVDSPLSNDNLELKVSNYKCKYLKSKVHGRAFQMNHGAKNTYGIILFFVHADTILPKNWLVFITENLNNGADFGCFSFKFKTDIWLLKINNFLSKLPFLWCRGGDQTLLIKRIVFNDLGGFDPNYVIMEDYDIIKRAKKKYKFSLMKNHVLVSDRKYKKNSYFRVQYANFLAFKYFFSKKVSPSKIKNMYNTWLDLKY
jgi:rSAM/selenodomain-associated transferase 2